jgi:uncharacterized delta-60 repeat protein
MPASSQANFVTAQPNGKVLVTVARGNEAVIARLDRDGKLDRDFGQRGFASPTDRRMGGISGLVVGPSGKIDVAGRFLGIPRPREFVMQLRKNGTLDGSFGTNGVAVPLPTTLEMGGLAMTPDGHLLVGAASGTPQCFGFPTSDPCRDFQLVARMNPNGQLDPSFGEDGVTEIPVYSTYVDLALAPDGRITTGTLAFPPSMQADGLPVSYVSRLLADGSLDQTFGAGTGYVEVRTPVSRVELSGELTYAGGSVDGLFGAAVLGSDGSIDQAFGSDGAFSDRIGQVAGSSGDLLREANGDLLIAGPVASDCRPRHPVRPDQSRCRLSATVVRVSASGDVDTDFGDDGVAKIAMSKSRKVLDGGAVELLDSGDGLRMTMPIFNGPRQDVLRPDSPSAFAVAALRNNGSLDHRYGDRGVSLIPNEVR